MKNQIALLSILILLTIFAVGSPALSHPLNITPSPTFLRNIIYVDDDNILGPWEGTVEHPYQFIQHAIDAATPGDTIHVFSGTYPEHLIINKMLQIEGENTTATKIIGEETPVIVDIRADNTHLNNFTIKNSSGNPGTAGIKITAKHTQVHSCYIYRTRTAITIQNTSNFTITHCRIYVNGEGILIKNSSNGIIHAAYITQNGLGIHITQSNNITTTLSYIHTNGIGIFINKSAQLFFETCAVSKNCDNQGAIFMYDASSISITDCNFIHNGVGLKIETSTNITIQQSTLQWNTHFTIMARKNCSNITITSCDIAHNYRYGLHLKDSTLQIQNNNFYHNRLYGIHATNTQCKAQNNWWNRTLGPAFTGLTQADRVSFDPKNIHLFPWKTAPLTNVGSTWATQELFAEYPLPTDADRILFLPGNDTDLDRAPDWWEEKWNYDPLIWNDHGHLDPDHDALNNLEECYSDAYGSNPYQKDLFLEFDWTLSSIPENTNKPSSEKIHEMTQRFAEHNITLHVDTGEYDGGEEIPYCPPFKYDTLRNLYWNYFLHNDINNPRKGIFHYGIICDVGPGPGFSFIGWYHHDAFCISAQTLEDGNPLWVRDQLIITGSMHELGHTLGLFADDHNGNDNRAAINPWYKDYWLFRNYKSCMNYRYTWQILDYSDGTHGTGDYDDWGNLDFEFFKNTYYGSTV